MGFFKTTASLFFKYLSLKAGLFENSAARPRRKQRELLFEILRKNSDCAYLREHGAGEINTIEDFRKKLPVTGYDRLRPYIERMKRGQNRILTGDTPYFFGLTSGTTGTPKLIPVTRSSAYSKKKVTDLWSYYIYRDHPEILEGSILAVMNRPVKGRTPAGIPYGFETGFGYRNMPFLIRRFYCLHPEIFDIRDNIARYYCILRYGMQADITTFASPNPNTIILLCKNMHKWGEKIIRDIAVGEISGNMRIEENIRNTLISKTRPAPERASKLQKILKENGKLTPELIWPRLALIECWQGGPVRIYLKELSKYFGSTPLRDFGYLSTEARCSIPMEDNETGGVLAIDSNFYEFFPVGKNMEDTLLADELKKGEKYRVIVTTPGGLYRYDMNDIIEVKGFFKKTPVIEFLEKGINTTDLAGEKLHEAQMAEAVKKATSASGIGLKFFTAVAIEDQPPSYAFIAEFDGAPDAKDKKNFLELTDSTLSSLNILYKKKRSSGLLAPPELMVAPEGTLEKYRRKKAPGGETDSQFKPPELTSRKEIFNEIITEEKISLEK
jgi:hypothetical protein